MFGKRNNNFVFQRLGGLLFWGALAVSIPVGLRAGSIFDDDFQAPPAARPKTPDPAPPSTDANPPAPVPVPATNPGAPETAPSGARAADAAPAEPAKREIPSKLDREKSRSLLKEIYGQELADHSQSARRALANKFLQDAGKSSNAPSDEFVLLGGAILAAQEAADLPLTFQAADAMAKDFLVDAVGLKAQSLLKMPQREFARNREENQPIGLSLMDELEKRNDFAEAERVGNILQQNSAGGTDRTAIQQRVKSIHDKQLALSRAESSLTVLKTSPDNPSANLEAGRYFCLMKGDWAAGLPMLVKGSDASMKALATKERTAAAGSSEPAQLGDAWWDAAEREPTPLWKKPMQERAGFWYRQALNGATGLAKVKIEKRIQSLPQDLDPAAEARTVLEEVVDCIPQLKPFVGDAKLLRVHTGADFQGGARKKIPGSFSNISNVTTVEVGSRLDSLPAGHYLFAFRIQSDLTDNQRDGHDLICDLKLQHGNGMGMAAMGPRASYFHQGKWTSVGFFIAIGRDDMFQYVVQPHNGHSIAIDRIYVFKAN